MDPIGLLREVILDESFQTVHVSVMDVFQFSVLYISFWGGDHCHNLQADILLHCESKVSEGGDDFCYFLHHGAHVLSKLVHGDGAPHHRGQAGLQRHQVGGNLLVGLGRGAVAVGGAHPVAVDGLEGGGGQDQELVPLVGQQPRVDLDRDLGVEGKAAGPLHQLEHDPVPDPAELVRQLRVAVVQQVRHIPEG